MASIQKISRNNAPYWTVQFVGDDGQLLTANCFDPSVGSRIPQSGSCDLDIQFDQTGRRRVVGINGSGGPAYNGLQGPTFTQATQANVPGVPTFIPATPQADTVGERINRTVALNNAVLAMQGKDVPMRDLMALADGFMDWLKSGNSEWCVYFDAERDMLGTPAEAEAVNDPV